MLFYKKSTYINYFHDCLNFKYNLSADLNVNHHRNFKAKAIRHVDMHEGFIMFSKYYKQIIMTTEYLNLHLIWALLSSRRISSRQIKMFMFEFI